MDQKELLETLEAQQKYIEQIEQEKEELQNDFDHLAINLIGFAKDFGVEEFINKSKGKEMNTAQKMMIGSMVLKKFTSGNLSLQKMENLAPLLDKYQSRYKDHF